jgi:hypothetical protein
VTTDPVIRIVETDPPEDRSGHQKPRPDPTDKRSLASPTRPDRQSRPRSRVGSGGPHRSRSRTARDRPSLTGRSGGNSPPKTMKVSLSPLAIPSHLNSEVGPLDRNPCLRTSTHSSQPGTRYLASLNPRNPERLTYVTAYLQSLF